MNGSRILSEWVKIQISSNAMRLVYGYSWWIVPVFVATGLMYGFRNVLKELGLQSGFLKALVFSVLVVLPMFAGAALTGPFDSELTFIELLKKTVLAGFMEEMLFRGFLFGLLFRKLKWGFIPASLPAAIIFGLAHLYQGSGLLETFGIFTVTTIGALWFAWLYIEWDNNLWIAVLIHILMNLSWTLFDVSSNALGDWRINISRIITIAMTVVITIVYCRRRKEFKINRNNLLLNK
jgi:uncharacterized protein